MTEKEQITQGAAILKQGGIVAFPTETVYGLGAVATDAGSIRRVFEAKKRPFNHPVIVHIAHLSQIEDWASHVSSIAKELMNHFWPGPLTLIVPRHPCVLDAVTGGQNTVAIRMPDHSIALNLIKATEQALIAPSANRFGGISPTHSDHVKQSLGEKVDFVIEGGWCEIGIESTIIDVSSGEPQLLRWGAVTAKQIQSVLNLPILFPSKKATIRVSGALKQHYAPSASLSVVGRENFTDTLSSLLSQGKKVAVLSQQTAFTKMTEATKKIIWFQMPIQPQDYMRKLYQVLFLADQQIPDLILVEALPDEEEWNAVKDRLIKATH